MVNPRDIAGERKKKKKKKKAITCTNKCAKKETNMKINYITSSIS